MNYLNFVKKAQERDTLSGILILFGFVCIAFVVASIIQLGIIVVTLASNLEGDFDLNSLQYSLTDLIQNKANWWGLVIMQGLSSTVLFICSSLAYWAWIERKKWADFNSDKIPVLYIFLLVFVIQLFFLPLNSYLGSLNENMKFPESLAWLEKMFKEWEESSAGITEFLAKTDTLAQLFANIVVIGIVAGVGEELIFRGIIQRKLIRSFNNYHLAIWTAAFIFSAIHFQFYGFFPRLFLGALFGYFYVWTGNIWVPIAAHIFNNSLAVIIYHLINKGVISEEYEKMDTIPLPYVALATVGFACLVYYFKKQVSLPKN